MVALRFAPAPAHDFPLLQRTTLVETVDRLRRYHLQGPRAWGYRPARDLLPIALEKSEPVDWIMRQVLLSRPFDGREANAEVVRTLCDLANKHRFRVRPAPRWSLPVRRDISIPIAADAFIEMDGRQYLFWMQLRCTQMVPTKRHLGLLGRLFLQEAARQGHDSLGLVIADMRHTADDRRGLQLYTLDDLPVATFEEAERLVQQIVSGYDQLITEGFDPKAERRAKKAAREEKRPPPPDLFHP